MVRKICFTYRLLLFKIQTTPFQECFSHSKNILELNFYKKEKLEIQKNADKIVIIYKISNPVILSKCFIL